MKGGYKKRLHNEESQSDTEIEQEEETEMLLPIEQLDDSIVKEEMTSIEPAFVNVNILPEQSYSNEITSPEQKHNHSEIMQCVDEVIQWSTENEIESLYLKMLQSLRNRILYKIGKY